MTITRALTLGRANVPFRCHVCAFFSDSDDEGKVVLPFMREGLHTGDKTVCIMDQSLRSERLRRLAQSGFDIANAEVSGQLELRSWENAPLQPARFDRGAMIELVEEVAKAGGKYGKGATRLWVKRGMGTVRFAGYQRYRRIRVMAQPLAAELRYGHGLCL
jgi:hypothetical protein